MAAFVLGTGGPRRTRLRQGTLEFTSARGVPRVLRLLVEALPAQAPARILVGHDSEGVPALAARALHPDAALVFHHLDRYVGDQVQRSLARNGVADVEVAITGDLPLAEGGFDLVALPFPARGTALLAREWIEAAHDRLALGGRFLGATDGPPGWLHAAVCRVFGRADYQGHARRDGAVVCARRTRDGERHKDRTHPITVARGTRELTILTRPGVFVYGRLDGGARAVLETLSVESGECVLDLGSGTGVLGLAAALDAGPEGTVLVDSNARAVDLARASAELNGLGAVTVCLRGDLERIPGGPFDLVLANPPYYGDGRIASAFAAAAAEHASPQGRCLFVTKAAGMHDEILRGCFTRVASRSVGDYVVFEASRGRA